MSDRLIDRLYTYLHYKDITPYALEQKCGLSNGYLGKQAKGKGTIGSDILEKIYRHYFDLSLIWLITGEGTMLLQSPHPSNELKEDAAPYYAKTELIKLLNSKIELLEKAVKDKEQIIGLLNAERNTPR